MRDIPELGGKELQRLQEISDLTNDKYKGDPNFMTLLARGLEVLQAFKPHYSRIRESLTTGHADGSYLKLLR